MLDVEAVRADGGPRLSHRSGCCGEDPAAPGIAHLRACLGAGRLCALSAAYRATRPAVLESGCRVRILARAGRLQLRGRRRRQRSHSLAASHHPTAAVRFSEARVEASGLTRCAGVEGFGPGPAPRHTSARQARATAHTSLVPVVDGELRLGGSDCGRPKGSGGCLRPSGPARVVDLAHEQPKVQSPEPLECSQ